MGKEQENQDLPYRRILLKLSGEVLQNRETGDSLDEQTLVTLASQLKRVFDLGTDVAVVVGGGNIFRGLSGVGKGIDRTTGDHMGMLATVINALALQAALESQDIPTRVMTAMHIPSVAEPFIRLRAIRHLEKRRVVIFGGGTGNPYFTTDSAAALRASEIKADVLLKATKVDGIYTADPMKDKTAERYEHITYQEALAKQLRVMDAAAFSLCMDNHIPIMVFNYFEKNALFEAVTGKPVGTLVSDRKTSS